MSVDVSAIFPLPTAKFQDAGAEENQTHLPNAANEIVDLIRPNEQSVSPKSTDATSLTSLLARSAARSSFRDLPNASWRGYGPLPNSLDNVQSRSSKAPDYNDSSPDNGEEMMQRSSFRRSSKPIRRRSTIQKAPRPEIHKVFKPVAASRKNNTNPVTIDHLGTDNLSFQPPVVLNPRTSNPPYSANGNIDCRPKIYRRDPAAGTNPVPSERFDNDTTQQVPTYQNVGPALRGSQSSAAISRRRESADNDSAFLEPSLTGDEHCVEDWPVGSPELDPNFRPTGSLRLRRESLRLKDLEEVISELTQKSSKRRTWKRFKSKTKTTSQQNQDPQGGASNDVSSNSATSRRGDLAGAGAPSPDSSMPAMTTSGHLPSPDPQLGATSSLSISGTLTRLPSQGAQNSSEDLELTRDPFRSSSGSLTSSNPWVHFGNSSGNSAPVNPLAGSGTNHPKHSPYRPTSLDQAAAVNPLPTIYEANNIPRFNAQAAAQAGNNMSAATRNQEDDVAVNDATVAMADWLAAQMDEINRAREAEEEEEGDGDTDSLMEWWNTVEGRNELPLHVYNVLNWEEERRTFSILIDKVRRALIVFYRVFTECADILWQSVIIFKAFADDIEKLRRVEMISEITFVVAIILASFTMGVSVIAFVPAFGVAAYRKANIKKDIKKVAAILVDNVNYHLEMQKILTFINTGLLRLRDHLVLRSSRGFTGDEQEIQKAVQMQRLLTAPVSQALAATTRAVNAVQGILSGMERFIIHSQEILKKKRIREIVAEIKGSADVLHSCVFELSNIKNQLQVATESCGLTE